MNVLLELVSVMVNVYRFVVLDYDVFEIWWL